MARPRVLIYGGVLIAISAALIVSLSLRHTLKVDVVRDRATLARIVDEGTVENVYRLQLMNASEQPKHLRVSVSGIPGAALASPVELEVGPAQARWITLAVRVPYASARAAGPGAHPIRFGVVQAAVPGSSVSEKSTFVIPR